MRTIKLVLLISFLHFPYNYTQWHWQNPLPFGNVLYGIQFLNENVGYACGYGSTIIKTTNGGIDWQTLDTGHRNFISHFFFLTEDIGWYYTYSEKTIAKTIDGGNNWTILTSLAPKYARALWFFDELKGFAVGWPCLLYTTDGGYTWYEDNSVFSPHQIFFINNNIGFITQVDSPLPGGARGGFITLKVYDVLGREVATLVNEERPAGVYEVTFDASSASGGLSRGVYYYQLRVDSFIETKKMILLR